MSQSKPKQIKLHKQSKTLELIYADGQAYQLPAEYLRVLSPSAEVRGHGNPVLQVGKINVALTGVQPVGHYALKLIFDDGHDSGLYHWEYLYKLCTEREQLWNDYLEQLREAGAQRDPDVSVVRLM